MPCMVWPACCVDQLTTTSRPSCLPLPMYYKTGYDGGRRQLCRQCHVSTRDAVGIERQQRPPARLCEAAGWAWLLQCVFARSVGRDAYRCPAHRLRHLVCLLCVVTRGCRPSWRIFSACPTSCQPTRAAPASTFWCVAAWRVLMMLGGLWLASWQLWAVVSPRVLQAVPPLGSVPLSQLLSCRLRRW